MSMRESDLFGRPALDGLAYLPDVVPAAAEKPLVARIDAAGLAPFRFQGWTGKRLTASFGWRYDFDTGSFAETAPLPPWLLPLREQASRLAGVPASDFVQALLIRYDPGAGIGWHRDRPVFEHVVGISLGAAATLRLRRRRAGGFDRHSLLLEPRSAYLLSGEARHAWEHSIAPIEVPRWSITLRSLSERGRRFVTPES